MLLLLFFVPEFAQVIANQKRLDFILSSGFATN